MIERLVRGGADVHARFTKDLLQLRLYDEPGNIVDNVTAIHMASFRGPAIVNVQDVEGNTALHYAASYFGGNGEASMPAFETLCGKGADASIQNNRGDTPLHNMLASVDGTIDKQILSLLLAHGAKINDLSRAGNSPLHIAARRLDHHGVIDFLIEQGADTTIGHLRNNTPVHIAGSGDAFTPGLAEKIEIQDGVLATLTKSGGIELMDLPNAEGRTPRQICKAQRDKWRENEEKEHMINKRREQNFAIAASCLSS
ncbi:ankyrin [Fusarium acutatum]|uniref:Ankyrin n=1 Tax=Fusarium acutatum TaxID=78861 RepID=A0A8H4N9B0_9HYPO|nr:ankyrin [Fusarium acutatum]